MDEGPLSDRTAGIEKPIIVADDDEDILALAAFCLKGHRILTARNGEEALELARTQDPALVLLDIRMPKISGDGVLRALRQHRTTARIPVVLFSAYAQKEMVTSGLRAGADAYLIKPFSPSELVEGIEELLTNAGSAPASKAQPSEQLVAAPA